VGLSRGGGNRTRGRRPDIAAPGGWVRLTPISDESLIENTENAMAKGQMRSNKEKKKPKQEKNKQKGPEAPSQFAGMHSQSKPATSYASLYGRKH
jgi:hypothetical protein